MENKIVLAGLPFRELKDLLSSYPSFRASQIYRWICSGEESFTAMSNIPAALQNELAQKYSLKCGTVSSELRDRDGTIKLGITMADGAVLEAVILSDNDDRKTACLSTQAGCPMGCVFCKTGKLGLKRSLSAREIAGQFLELRKKEPRISHAVIMGMGEPLLNLAELRKALDFIMDPKGLNISKRRITLSTCGIVKGIHDLAREGPDIRLAFSLVSARQDLREKLMPVSKENPLPLVKEALRCYQEKRGRRITLEIVLLGGINTSREDAEAAAEFARGLDAVINLIPWNPVEGMEFEGKALTAPAQRERTEFAAALERHGLNVTRRTEKGQGISGACGQLGSV